MKLTNIDIIQIIKDVIMRTDKLKYTYSKKHPNSKYTLDFIINELIYVLKSGVSWRDLRSEINYNTLYWHFKRFNNCDVFQRAFTICRNRVMKKKLGIIIIDTTIISNKYGRNKVSRNRFHKNKKCTKVSAITDVNGLPLTIIADKGSKHDLKFLNSQVRKIKKKLTAETILLADRGYVSFKHLKSLGESGVQLMAKKTKINTNDGKKTIQECEQILVDFSSKTVDHDEFLAFINAKTTVRADILGCKEYHDYLKKHRWHSYLDKRRHEDKLAEEIKSTFGKDAVYIIGDWCEKQSSPLRFISTPGIGMRRIVRKAGIVFLIDEYRTSMYREDTDKKLNNLQIEFNNRWRKLHSVLTYQMGNRRIGCINRDLNSVQNMQSIVESLLETKKRPEIFTRKAWDHEKSLSPDNDSSSSSSSKLSGVLVSQRFSKSIIDAK